MLNLIRRNSDSPAVKGILILIGLSFVVGFGVLTGGVDTGSVKGTSIVATVNDKNISANELAREYRRLYDQIQNEMGDQFNEDVLERLNLRYQALNTLVTEKVVVDYADKVGLRVGDKEIFSNIKEIEYFQDESGRFSPERYKSVLRSSGRIAPEVFEEDQHDGLMMRKVRNYIVGSVVVAEEEALQAYIRENTSIDAWILRLSPAEMIASVQVSNEDIEAFYEANQGEFQTGQQADIEYLRVSPSLLESSIEITEDKLQAWFQEHKADYAVQEDRVRARHILIKTDGTTNEAALAEAQGLVEQIRGGADFAELAAQHSADASNAQNGGDLGFFSRGQMVPPFEKAAFETPVGQIAGPVETKFGYHIVEVLEKESAGEVAFETVRGKVQTDYMANAVPARMEELKQEIGTALAGGSSLKETAEKLGLQYKADLWMENAANIPEQISASFMDANFPANGDWIVFNNVGYWVKVLERMPSETRALVDVRPQIESRLQREQALTRTAEKANEAIQSLRNGTDPKEVASAFGARIESTGPLPLSTKSLPGISDDEKVVGTFKRLSEKAPVAANTVRIDNDFAIFALRERVDVTLEDYQEVADEYRAQIREESFRQAWTNWIQSVRQTADIEMYNSPAGQL